MILEIIILVLVALTLIMRLLTVRGERALKSLYNNDERYQEIVHQANSATFQIIRWTFVVFVLSLLTLSFWLQKMEININLATSIALFFGCGFQIIRYYLIKKLDKEL
ncbi:hypothetical protein ACFO26_02590 [Lactococcus nasutitermitis]|uniref:Uncharacterized protein n=1 Tax=Lactococcus nasutitermitis TaxID=1652957 RepID=A0ABV9JB95_9LACT|nr:hypothetical protein [Lactococcus nasutitermitis]